MKLKLSQDFVELSQIFYHQIPFEKYMYRLCSIHTGSIVMLVIDTHMLVEMCLYAVTSYIVIAFRIVQLSYFVVSPFLYWHER